MSYRLKQLNTLMIPQAERYLTGSNARAMLLFTATLKEKSQTQPCAARVQVYAYIRYFDDCICVDFYNHFKIYTEEDGGEDVAHQGSYHFDASSEGKEFMPLYDFVENFLPKTFPQFKLAFMNFGD